MKKNLFDGDLDDSSRFVLHLKGQSLQVDFVKISGFSKSMISKWINGTTEPNLHHILALIENTNSTLLEFVQEIIDLDKIDALRGLRELQSSRKNLLYDFPETAAILACLELKECQGKITEVIKLISKRLELDIKYVEKVIEKMRITGFVEINRSKIVISKENFDTRGSILKTISLRDYWINQALAILNTTTSFTDKNRFSHFVFSISDEGDKLLRKASYEYFSAMKAIVQNDKAIKTQIRNINLQDIEVKELMRTKDRLNN